MRFRLDPFSPTGIAVDIPPKVIQSNGYVQHDATGLIQAGPNVTLTGQGTTSDPYTISATGGGGGGTVAPAGSTNDIQYNDGSATAGSDNFTWNNAAQRLTVISTDGDATPHTMTLGAGIASGTDSGGLIVDARRLALLDGSTYVYGDTNLQINTDTGAATFSNDVSITGTATAANLSGTNTGDQDLSSLVPEARTINGHSLSANVTVTGDDVLPSQTGNSGKYLTTNGTTSSWASVSSSGGSTLPPDAAGWLHDNGTGTLAWSAPTKSDLGLGSVDNTSDATKNSAAATLTNKDLTSATNTFPTFNQSTTGSAAKLTTGRTIGITGDVAYTSPAFDGSANVTASSTVTKINGTSLAGLSTGILKNTTTTGVPSIAVASDFPVLNQNTTGTAANVTGTVAITNGGTGQTTQQAALNALAGTQSAGKYLRSDGTNTTLTTIQATDVPTLNQNTTGTAANITGTLPVAQGGTGATATTGSGANVLATSPSLTTPKADFLTDTNGGKEVELVATASSANWVKLTNTIAGSGVTIGVNGTGTNENLTLAAMGAGTVQIGSSQITTAANTQTLTGKTFNTAGTGNSFSINGTAITAVTGTGNAVLSTSPLLTTPNLLGTSSPPATPGTGQAILFGVGTGTVRPHWINSSGTDETIMTSATESWSKTARVIPTGSRTSTSTSYVAIPTDTVVLSSLVKKSASTDLKITVGGSCFVTVGGGTLSFGVNFNAVDNDIYQQFTNVANQYFSFYGTRSFSGVAAGTYTFTLKVKVSAGTWGIDGNGLLNMTVEEVYSS